LLRAQSLKISESKETGNIITQWEKSPKKQSVGVYFWQYGKKRRVIWGKLLPFSQFFPM